MTKQRVSAQFEAFNPRRMSRPWIARITSWPVGGNPILEFGAYVGDQNGGEVEILAAVGDIIRCGQKDQREGTNTWSDWRVVDVDYSLIAIKQVDARRMFNAVEAAQ